MPRCNIGERDASVPTFAIQNLPEPMQAGEYVRSANARDEFEPKRMHVGVISVAISVYRYLLARFAVKRAICFIYKIFFFFTKVL